MSKHVRGPAGQSFFGIGLRQMREARAATVHTLVSGLSHAGYTVTSDDYLSLESGAFFPEQAARFIGAFEASLGLSSAERQDLEERLAYDILHARLGERAKSTMLPHPDWS
jgi:hypothetical protein